MESNSKEDNVIIHFKDNKAVAVTIFNGHADLYELGEPMGRAKQAQFYETSTTSSKVESNE
jgi:hypothetical protein